MVLPGWRDRSGASQRKGGEQTLKNSVLDSGGPWLDWGQQTWMWSTEGPILPAVCAPRPSTPPQGTVETSPGACRAHPLGSRGWDLPRVSEGTSQQAGESIQAFVTTLSKNITLPPLRSRAGAGSKAGTTRPLARHSLSQA